MEVKASYVSTRARFEAAIPPTPTEVEVIEEPLPDVIEEPTTKAAPDQGAPKT